MDVNGTRFHLLQGERDFAPLVEASVDADDLEWSESRGGVGLRGRIPRFPRRAAEPRLSVSDRRGADRDRYGNFYWIAPDQRSIRLLPAGSETAGDFWTVAEWNTSCPAPPEDVFAPVAPRPPASNPELRGLAVTRHHYLVVGTLEPAGLLVFDLHSGGPPEWQPWPAAVPIAPFDMSADGAGETWILDRGPLPGESRVWRLNRHFCVAPPAGEPLALEPQVTDEFAPVGGLARTRPERSFPTGLPLGSGSPTHVAEPVAIEVLPDGSVLLLETERGLGHSRIHRLVAGEIANVVSLAGALSDVLEDSSHAAGAADLRAHDFEFLPAHGATPGEARGTLYLIADDGNQAFAFDLDARGDQFRLTPGQRYLPVRRFSGKGLVAGGCEVFYDSDELWLPLAEQPRLRYPPLATLAGILLDGKQPGCRWHRLLLDACIPEGCSVRVESRAAEAPELLPLTEWAVEPDLVLRRRSEVPLHQPFPEERDNAGRSGTWELLLQDASGQHFELRLILHGNRRSTPRVRALRVYYPRFSYLNEYLPTIYQEEPRSAHFLDRFLANVEGLYTSIEGRIEHAEALFDARTAPPESLDWLAGWLGSVLDPTWDAARRRLFIAH
ncbi:MAG: hypothetical protein KY476_27275, partial [Planctomycetes bacterium]|nr:hypothetical protein [Planctomycetota bacterium]